MKRHLGTGLWIAALLVLLPSVAFASPPENPAQDSPADLLPVPSLEPSEDEGESSPQTQAVDPNDPTSLVQIDDENESGPWYNDFSGFVDLSGGFGAASILSDAEFTQTDYFALTTAAGLRYNGVEDFTFGLGAGFTKFLTENGDSVFQRATRPADTTVFARWNGWQDKDYTKIRINGGITAVLPTSDVSRATDRYMRTNLDVGVSRSFGGLTLAYGFRYAKNFHAYTSIVGDPDELDLLARDGGNENIDGLIVSSGGVLPSFGIQNRFSVGFGFLQDFNFSAGLIYIDNFTYDNGTITQDDEFVNENALVGRGHSQLVVGTLSLGMGISKNFSAYVASSTVGQPFASDNRSLRFPFWDLENGQAARSDLSLGVTASF